VGARYWGCFHDPGGVELVGHHLVPCIDERDERDDYADDDPSPFGAWWVRCQFDPSPVEPAPGQVWCERGVERVIDAVEEWDQARWVIFVDGQLRPWIDFVGDPTVCCVMRGGPTTAPAPPPGWREQIACHVEGVGERVAARAQQAILAGGACCVETIRGASRVAGALLRGRTA